MVVSHMAMCPLLIVVFGAVAVVAISGSVGAVAAEDETGYPPVPVSGLVGGMGGFEVLEGAWDVATAEMEGRTYAVVASMVDDGIQVVDITR